MERVEVYEYYTVGKKINNSSPNERAEMTVTEKDGCSNWLQSASDCELESSNKHFFVASRKAQARLAQSVEHETLNLRVVGSSPTLGDSFPSFRIYVVAIFYMLWHPRKYSLHLSPDTWPRINWRCKKAIAYKMIFPLKKEATLLLTTVMRSSSAALTPCANVVGASCPLTENSSNIANFPYNFAKTICLR